ncbi:hypothetical protein CXR25_13825 [Brevibacterium aurantiacum]|uniref:glycerophosphodiester phosphodiesterase n=1 Tax=Brevibacterium aurantiacum TaxID=273384 RepID=UPI000F651CA4|nr:glycerophosphodiester phosphodiesterase family protein [Brevibacterium aurantiacum]AZL13774.1 hypothetical protein CXR25_13825 [Brevibacterium aurantiacum]
MRKRVVVTILAVVAVTALLASVLSVATKGEEVNALSKVEYPAVAAHRCGAALYAECTLEGAKAVNAEDPDVILEFDVQQLKDGAFVVIHDDAIDRVAAGGKTGKVSDMTVAQWEQLRIKDPTGGDPAPATFLSEMLDEFGDTDTVMMIELKAPDVNKFIETLWPYRGQVIAQSFEDKVTSVLARSGLNTIQLVSGTSTPTIVDGVDAVGMHMDRLNTTTAKRITDTGVKLWTWGANLKSNDPAYLDLGVDGFLVNDPTR